MTPAQSRLPSGLIDQAQFDRAAARWISVVAAPHPKALRRSLQPTEDKSSRLLLVAYSLEHVLLLLSTVGASYVNARFLLQSPAGREQEGEGDHAEAGHAGERFTVALYASDVNGVRLSAYFLPEGPEQLLRQDHDAADEPPVGNSSGSGAKQVPFHMVKTWLDNWRQAPEITPAMFTTAYGPLEGYRFNLSDFRESLFNAQPLVDGVAYSYALRIDFGLHHYYSATQDRLEPTATFGLVLRLQSYDSAEAAPDGEAVRATRLTGSTGSGGGTGDPGEPFYDMSTPCPPGH